MLRPVLCRWNGDVVSCRGCPVSGVDEGRSGEGREFGIPSPDDGSFQVGITPTLHAQLGPGRVGGAMTVCHTA